MDQMDERQRDAYHVAGHAVASALRGAELFGGSRLTPCAQGVDGPDWGGSPANVLPFVAYAGAWAQARAGWLEVGCSGVDARGRSFDEHVADTLLAHPIDATAVTLAEYEVIIMLRDGGADEQECWRWIRGVSFAWSGEMNEVWPVVDDIACSLLRGETVEMSQVWAATHDRLAALYC